MTQSVSVDSSNGISTVTLDRGEAFNAFDLTMAGALAEALVTLGADPSVRAVLIAGRGKAFCAGGDLKWVASHPAGAAAAFHELAARFHLAVTEIRRMPKPVIAAVDGIAAGGGFSLALACDFRVLGRSARLRQAYTSSGLCVDGGGTFTLPRLVGLARALEIVAFDPPISADQALAWGLATRVVDDGSALAAARELAESVAGSLHAFGATKQLLTDAFDTSLETHIERERQALSECARHSDGQEGLRAFSGKRRPNFRPTST